MFHDSQMRRITGRFCIFTYEFTINLSQIFQSHGAFGLGIWFQPACNLKHPFEGFRGEKKSAHDSQGFFGWQKKTGSLNPFCPHLSTQRTQTFCFEPLGEDYFKGNLKSLNFYFLVISGQIITTSADVTLNGGLIRELPQNPLNSGLGIILICPVIWWIPISGGSKLDFFSTLPMFFFERNSLGWKNPRPTVKVYTLED